MVTFRLPKLRMTRQSLPSRSRSGLAARSRRLARLRVWGEQTLRADRRWSSRHHDCGAPTSGAGAVASVITPDTRIRRQWGVTGRKAALHRFATFAQARILTTRPSSRSRSSSSAHHRIIRTRSCQNSAACV